MTIKKTAPLILILIAVLCSNCSKENETDTVTTVNATIYHQYVPFILPISGTEINALRIKEDGSSDWITVTHISNFDYEPNHEYRVTLKKTVLAHPPQDSSDTIYELIEVQSKIRQ